MVLRGKGCLGWPEKGHRVCLDKNAAHSCWLVTGGLRASVIIYLPWPQGLQDARWSPPSGPLHYTKGWSRDRAQELQVRQPTRSYKFRLTQNFTSWPRNQYTGSCASEPAKPISCWDPDFSSFLFLHYLLSGHIHCLLATTTINRHDLERILHKWFSMNNQ